MTDALSKCEIEYDKKGRELKQRQAEIALRIEQHQKGEGDFRTTLESLISVASRAAELFERSKTEQKRQLVGFVFSNLRLRGKKLEYSLRSPFDLMVNRASYSSGFLNTVRTERFDQVLALRSLLPAVAKVALRAAAARCDRYFPSVAFRTENRILFCPTKQAA
jgi:hypothetical protein